MRYMNHKPGWWLLYFFYCAIPIAGYVTYLLRRSKETNVMDHDDEKKVPVLLSCICWLDMTYFSLQNTNITLACKQKINIYQAMSVFCICLLFCKSLENATLAADHEVQYNFGNACWTRCVFPLARCERSFNKLYRQIFVCMYIRFDVFW